MTSPRRLPPDAISVVARFTARPGKEAELKRELLALVPQTRAEPGCINYDLHQDPDRPGEFVFYENFTSMAALEEHAAMPYIARLLEQVVGRLCINPAEISTWRMISEPGPGSPGVRAKGGK